MQQIAVNQMNGTSGGSLRQKLDLSDACQATDAFAMLFMQLMGQTSQPEALLHTHILPKNTCFFNRCKNV